MYFLQVKLSEMYGLLLVCKRKKGWLLSTIRENKNFKK